METTIEIFSSNVELAHAVATRISTIAEATLKDKPSCSIALAGGGTPQNVYSLLAQNSDKLSLDWKRIKLFWGDERTVPPHHSDSNFKMAWESLLTHIEIPSANVFRMKGELDPTESASEYERILRQQFRSDPPEFDLILLGVGGDGHTASLFPGTEALENQQDLVTAVFVAHLNTWRITLTLPVMNAAKNVIFILSGATKARIVPLIVGRDQPSKEWPSTLIRPSAGHVYWMLDEEAAVNYKKES